MRATAHERDERLAALGAAARRAARRSALRRMLATQASSLPVPLVYAAAALTSVKLLHPSPPVERWLWWGLAVTLLLPLGGWLRDLLRRPSVLSGADALDRHHDLEGRVSGALAFLDERSRTPLMDAAIDDALERASRLDPRRAVPLQLPPELWGSAVMLLALVGLSQLEVRRLHFVPDPPVSQFRPLELSADDVEALREQADELKRQAQDPETLAAIERFNQLIEDLNDRRLDRQEAFRRLEQLERTLFEANELDREALDESLKALARELEKSGLTKPAAQALDQRRLDDAQEALKELAEKLSRKPAAASKAEIERLRKALEAASRQNAERIERIDAERQRVEEDRRRLLNKKQKGDPPLTRKEQQELERTERQLKQLDRQKQQADRAARELSQLDRELAEAARQLREELGKAGEHLERSAEELKRMEKRQLSDEEKRALKRQMEELREMLRQSGRDGENRQQQLERFRRMARGQSERPGESGGEQQGKQGQKPGEGKPSGLRPGGQGGDGVSLLDIPGAGPPRPGAPGAGDGSGPEAGGGPGSEVRGQSTELDGKLQDVSAAGIDSGQGESVSQIVHGAAQRGFASGGYRKVYTDYKTVAEEVLQSDEIPPGYKFYVRRYFQLIRPRD